jgi:uncharacterized damage-inducible protein DinB
LLTGLPAGFLDDLPTEDQRAISGVAGKSIVLRGYEQGGRAALEFDEPGTSHVIFVDPKFIRPTKDPLPRATLHSQLATVLLETYAASDAMNQLILAHLDPRAWRAKLPGVKRGGGRTIAAIFAHVHNDRLVKLKASAPHLKRPAPLDPARCTMKQAAAAHKQSAAQCLAMMRDALSDSPNRRVTKFSRGEWTRPWPAGSTMFAYMFSHEAHHRGQVLMLAHQLGYRLPIQTVMGGIWMWDKLWKQCGFTSGPR